MYTLLSIQKYNSNRAMLQKNAYKTNSIDSIEQQLSIDKNYHIFIGDTSMPTTLYLDLDGYMNPIDVFLPLYTSFMQSTYNVKINDEDISYTAGKPNSYHLSIPKFSASPNNQKIMMAKFNGVYGKTLDLSVYDPNGFYRMPNQTKPKEGSEIHRVVRGKTIDFFSQYLGTATNIDSLFPTEQQTIKKAAKKTTKKTEAKEDMPIQQPSEIETQKSADKDIIVKLLNILTSNYYTDRSLWLNVAMILKKFEKNNNISMYDAFEAFSRKSKKHEHDDIKSTYEGLNKLDIRINIGSLHHYANESNSIMYRDIMRENTKEGSVVISPKYLAIKIRELAPERFFYLNIASKDMLYSYDVETSMWYEENTQILQRFINDELHNYVFNMISKSLEDGDYKRKQLTLLSSLCFTIHGKKEILSAFSERYFNVRTTEEITFNAKHHLLAFTNGVYDLIANEFRPLRYDDYMTTSTGYAYKQASQTEIDTMNSIIDKIETIPERKSLLLKILSTGIIGKSYHKFCMLNGSGGNGKSLLNTYMSAALKDYFYKGNITSLCENAKQGASPELANMHQKRYVVFSEPESNTKIKNGMMKAMTGEETINARACYSNRTQIELVATVMLECNTRPSLQSEPGSAEERRLIDFPFESRFVHEDGMVDVSNRIYKADVQVCEKEFIQTHKHAFLQILIANAHEFLTTDKQEFKIPTEIQSRTDAYLEECTLPIAVLKSCTIKTNNKEDIVKISDLFDRVAASREYQNYSRDEKRKLNQKSMVVLYQKNKYTSNNYKERFQPKIEGKQLNFTNILVGFKMNEDVNQHSEYQMIDTTSLDE